MFYGIRVNSAIASLGVRPAAFDPDYRRKMQNIGQSSGNSPQEVALFMVAQLSMVHLTNLQTPTIKTWIRERKINPRSPEISDALGKLALWDLME